MAAELFIRNLIPIDFSIVAIDAIIVTSINVKKSVCVITAAAKNCSSPVAIGVAFFKRRGNCWPLTHVLISKAVRSASTLTKAHAGIGTHYF